MANTPKAIRKARTTYGKQILAELEINLDEYALTGKLVPEETVEYFRSLGREITPQSVMIHQLIVRAMLTGDVEALKFLRDTVGEKPSESLELGGMLEKPIETLDLSKLSDDQLRAMIALREQRIADKVADRIVDIVDEVGEKVDAEKNS